MRMAALRGTLADRAGHSAVGNVHGGCIVGLFPLSGMPKPRAGVRFIALPPESSMPRWIALLRAVNVGGRTVRMADLRGWCEELGFGGVATFIASGNLSFDARGPAPALERRIEAHLLARLGFAVGTFVRTPAELSAAAAFEAPGMRQGKTSLYVGFARSEPGRAALAAVQGLTTSLDRFHVRGREVYWVCHGSQGQSTISGTRLERALGMPLTLRNFTTVRRLAAQWGGNA